MRKNVASQRIGAQMITASDGSAFTGAVTVSVTGDAGTQATGSVGSGACTHEGNGYHTYAPAQAETNYDLIAFTFTGTGAIPVTVQVYTNFPQTGDSFALIGTTGSGLTSLASQASVDAIDNFVDTEIADIQSRLPAALVGGRIDANVGAISADSVAADNAEAFFDGTGYAGTNNVIPTVTTLTNLPSITSNWLTAAGLATDAVAEIADGVWDELLSGHSGVGSAGAALSAAGGSGDPWSTAVPGAYGVGTAGYIIGTNLDATVSSRASQTSVNTIDDFLDTEIAAILADTNELQTDWANGGRLDLILDARASQTSVDTIDDLLDTEIAALTTELAKVPKSDGTATWNATALASIQAEATDALNAYDPPTRAELTTDINSVLAVVDDLGVKKNTAFSNFEFLMVLASDHVTPATGLTVTGQRSIDGGAFASVSGTIAEVSNGIYQFDALAADTNGDLITWRFSAATADDTFVTFKTVA